MLARLAFRGEKGAKLRRKLSEIAKGVSKPSQGITQMQKPYMEV